ncbi:MAG: hypothetical protein J6U08_07320, partial [Paludibacteraceae bacterium]|nr:hypothetical protein [Paludibacteraceae bacterium]
PIVGSKCQLIIYNRDNNDRWNSNNIYFNFSEDYLASYDLINKSHPEEKLEEALDRFILKLRETYFSLDFEDDDNLNDSLAQLKDFAESKICWLYPWRTYSRQKPNPKRIKIGFCYIDRNRHYYPAISLLIVFVKNHLELRKSYGSHFKEGFFEDMVLYEEDENGEVHNLLELKDIPNHNNSSDMGYTISDPDQEEQTKLYYNGIDVYKDMEDSLEKEFYMKSLEYFSVSKKLNFLQEENKCKDKIEPWLKYVEELRAYLKTVDLNDILKDLRVKIWDWHKSIIGKDDSYEVYRQAFVSSPIVNKDNYLKKIIGTEKTCIWGDSSFCSWLVLHWKFQEEAEKEGIEMGDFTEEKLKKAKEEIKKNYSKEEHLGYLFAERITGMESNRDKREYNKWEKFYNETREELYDRFHFSEIANIKIGIEYDKLKDKNEYLKELNKTLKQKTLIL